MQRQKFLFICSLIGRNYNGVQRQVAIDGASLVSEVENHSQHSKFSNYTIQEALEVIYSTFNNLILNAEQFVYSSECCPALQKFQLLFMYQVV